MDFSLVGSHLNGGDLLVGLLNPTLTGSLSGSNSVTFEIDRNGVAAFSETFISNSAFTTFFHNNVLDFGAENVSLSGGFLNLDFQFKFNASSGFGGIETDLVFGNTVLTPEPSSVALLALGRWGCWLASCWSASAGAVSSAGQREGGTIVRLRADRFGSFFLAAVPVPRPEASTRSAGGAERSSCGGNRHTTRFRLPRRLFGGSLAWDVRTRRKTNSRRNRISAGLNHDAGVQWDADRYSPPCRHSAAKFAVTMLSNPPPHFLAARTSRLPKELNSERNGAQRSLEQASTSVRRLIWDA